MPLILNFNSKVIIVGGTIDLPIYVNRKLVNAYVVLSGNAVIV